MHELFAQLKALPDLNTTGNEWKLCLSIISSLQKKNSAHFRKKLAVHKQADEQWIAPNMLAEVCNYLDAWYKMSLTLVGWYSILGMTWYQFKKTELGADDLILLLMELLPTDPDLLSLLINKLALAAEIDTHKTGCIITQFYCAAVAKLRSPPANNPEEKEYEVKNIKPAIAHIHQYADFHRLQLACLSHEAYLKEKIACLINQCHRLQHGFPIKDKKNFFISALNGIESGSCIVLTQDNELIHLLQKHLILSDIKHTLFRHKKEINLILIEFVQKFAYYLENNNNDNCNNTTLFKYHAFSSPFVLVEEKLFSLAEKVTYFSLETPLNKNSELLLQSSFTAYENALYAAIKNYLSLFWYYKMGIVYQDSEKIFNDLFTNMQNNTDYILLSDKPLLYLFKKYQLLLKLKAHVNNAELLIFIEKFQQNYPLLAEKTVISTPNARMSAFYLRLFTFYKASPSQIEEKSELEFINAGLLISASMVHSTPAPMHKYLISR